MDQREPCPTGRKCQHRAPHPPSSPVPSEGSGSLPHGRSLPCPPTAGPSPGRGFCLPVLSPFPPLSPPIILPRSAWPGPPLQNCICFFLPTSRTHRCSDTSVSSYHSKGKTQFFGRKRTGLGGFFFLSLCPLAIVGCGLLGSMCGVYEPKGDLGTHLGVTPRVPRPLSDLSSSLHLSEACSV